MEPNLMKLGGSLKVPNVQELVAKEPLTTVPAEYVRPDQDPLIISNTSSLPQVPFIDLKRSISVDSKASELEKLHYACKEWGFFQLINHGVSSSLVDRVKLEIEEFFKLPMEEKKKYSQEPGDVEGYGQAFVVSEEQKLDWADLFYIVTLPTHLRKPHLFPKLPLPFRNTIEEYSMELKKLAMKLLELMGKALKLKDEEIKELFEEGMQSMRINYYPPCPEPELVIGLTPHSDSLGLTILLQVNEEEGLQIKKDGIWIPVRPPPNAFVVNIGDVLEIVTNGTYRSIEHRAIVNSNKERLSIATFFGPKLEDDVVSAPSLITPKTPSLFRRVSTADYLKGYLSRELQGKTYIDVLRI